MVLLSFSLLPKTVSWFDHSGADLGHIPSAALRCLLKEHILVLSQR